MGVLGEHADVDDVHESRSDSLANQNASRSGDAHVLTQSDHFGLSGQIARAGFKEVDAHVDRRHWLFDQRDERGAADGVGKGERDAAMGDRPIPVPRESSRISILPSA